MVIKITIIAKAMGKVQEQKILVSDQIAVTSFSDGSVKKTYEAMLRDKKDVSLKDNLLIERFIGKSKEEIVNLEIEQIEKVKQQIGKIMDITYTKEII